MKRDWDKIRQALLEVEAATGPSEERDQEMIHTYQILDDAGFVVIQEGQRLNGGFIGWVTVFRLTWTGHEFLSSIREDTTWNKVKAKAGIHMAATTFEVVKAMAVEFTKDLLGMSRV